VAVPVIIPELQFFEVERDFTWKNTVICYQVLLYKAPVSFDAIDIHYTISGFQTIIDSFMFESIVHQTVIGPELIRVAANPVCLRLKISISTEPFFVITVFIKKMVA
jgi:hypothetical protein